MKILGIVRDDEIDPASNYGSRHASVVGIGMMQGRDKVFKVLDQSGADVPIHQCSRVLQTIGQSGRSVLQRGAPPLIRNHAWLLRPEDVAERQLRHL